MKLNLLEKEVLGEKPRFKRIRKAGKNLVSYGLMGIAALWGAYTVATNCSCGSEEREQPRTTLDEGGNNTGNNGSNFGDDDSGDDGSERCVEPYAGMIIEKDTTFCEGEYKLSTSPSAIIITGKNIYLNGNGAILVSIDKEKTYHSMIQFTNARNISLENLIISKASIGIGGSVKIEGVTIKNVTVKDSLNCHVSLDGERIFIEKSYFEDSKNNGVFVFGSEGKIKDCESRNEREGVVESNFSLSGRKMVLDGNIVYTRNSSGCNALWIKNCYDCLVENNIVDVGYKDGSHFTHENRGVIFRNNSITTRAASFCVDYAEQASETLFYGNIFSGGDFLDNGLGANFCVDDVGNDFRNTSEYQGPDPHKGTCPEN